MTCHDLTDFLAAYVGNELAPDVRGTFERHLTGCPNCRRFLEQYEQTMAAGRTAFAALEDTPIPDDLVRAILSALREGS